MPFMCGLCDKSFPSRHSLDEHGRVHTGLRVYCEDPNCDKDFSNETNMRRHFRETHEREREIARRREERERRRREQERRDRDLIRENQRLREELARHQNNL